MARIAKNVTIRARVSFNMVQIGDTANVPLDARVQGWLDAGLVEVIHGAGQAGPGSAEPDAD
jgi:hypothetical protein